MGEEEEPIDFAYLRFVGVTRMGYTHREFGHLYFVVWADMLRWYKKQYNFETKKGLYSEERVVESVDLL